MIGHVDIQFVFFASLLVFFPGGALFIIAPRDTVMLLLLVILLSNCWVSAITSAMCFVLVTCRKFVCFWPSCVSPTENIQCAGKH